MHRSILAAVLGVLLAMPGVAHANVVLDWNALAASLPSPNPFVQSRTLAIVQLAVFEAVNAITGEYEPYLGAVEAPEGASADAAAVAAASRVLLTLVPGSAATIDSRRTSSLAAIPDGVFDYVWLIDTPAHDPALTESWIPVWRGRGSLLYATSPDAADAARRVGKS